MYPEENRYTKEHEWVRIDGDECVLGITDFAQEELGEVVYVELPAAGESFSPGDEIGTIESVKAVAEIYSPVEGEILERNEAVIDGPELLNENPHGDGWLVRIKLTGPVPEDLMSAAQYQELTEQG